MEPPIEDKIAAWLPEVLLEELRAAGPQVGSPPWVLEMSVAALAAAGHAALAEDVVARPAAVAAALASHLAAKEALPQGGRVWMRPELPWKDPVQLRQALRLATAAPSALRCLTGMVSAASAGEEALVEATYVCSECGKEARELGEEDPAPVCSCGGAMAADPARSVAVPCKTILLSPLSSPAAWDPTAPGGAPADGVASSVVVRLRDDLAGVCDVGDVVAVTGAAHVALDDKACGLRRPALGRLWVEALGARALGPGHRLAALTDGLEFSREAQCLLDRMRGGGLGAVLEAAAAWLHPTPLNALAQAALLLSAASSGARGDGSDLQEIYLFDPDPECDALHLGHGRGRGAASLPPPSPPPRVNVLVLTQGHDPVFERTLQQMARGLCGQVTYGGLAGALLLPAATAAPGAPPLAAGGQLAQANAGLCILKARELSAKQGRALGEALRHGCAAVALPGGAAATVPMRPTLWCLASGDDFRGAGAAPPPAERKQRPWGGAKAAARLPPSAAAAFADKLGPQLAAQFDVVLDCCWQGDADVEAWADSFLAGLVEGADSEDGGSDGEAARLALQLHVAGAQALPPPRMTPQAMQMLSVYVSAVREAGGAGAVPLTLEGAARLAAAAARLCHRRDIDAFPDAALAVALCEEALAARGWVPLLWGPLGAALAAGRATLEDCLREVCAQLGGAGKAGGGGDGWGAREE